MQTQTSPSPTGPADPSASSAAPTPMPKAVLCPYCGHLSLNTVRCEVCRGYFDPLSRQASQNSMGPWFIRDEALPFRPGCSYETLRTLIQRGKVTRDTIIRGPSTRQFWGCARNVPGVAHLLGECHACHAAVDPADESCPRCGASFACETDRQYFGLAPVHLLPGHSSPELIAASALSASVPAPAAPVPRVASQFPPPLSDPPPLTPALDRLAAPRSARGRGPSQATIVAIVLGLICTVMAGVNVYLAAGEQLGLVPPKPTSSDPATQPASVPVPEPTPAAPQEIPESGSVPDPDSEGDAGGDPTPAPNSDPGPDAPAEADPLAAMIVRAITLALSDSPEALAEAESLLQSLCDRTDADQVSEIVEHHLAFIHLRKAELALRARL